MVGRAEMVLLAKEAVVGTQQVRLHYQWALRLS
ncbi:MAG: hypothetical protein [Siphoviridae sp. ctdEk19]|nr:MAG: hypothetical protein [Siphoviridae sp. ctdEk19]